MATVDLPQVHLCIIQPAGYVDALAFLDHARHFRHQFRRLGAQVSLSKNRLRHGAINFVFGAHLGFDATLSRSHCCVFVNLEPLGAGGSQVSQDYLELLRGSIVVDHDAANVPVYASRPETVPVISPGFSPYLMPTEVMALEERPIDLLFIGAMNERCEPLIRRIESTGVQVTMFDSALYGPERDALIARSKAVLSLNAQSAQCLDRTRATLALSIGTPVIAETIVDSCRPGDVEDCTFWFGSDGAEAFFQTEYGTPQWFDAARSKLMRFAHTDAVEHYATMLGYCDAQFDLQLHKQNAEGAPAVRPERIHLGSGKDYRLGWLNLDLLEEAEPDLVVDLSRPVEWPLRARTPGLGPIELVPGHARIIYANNVLEHVADLPTLMTNCLALLATGGHFEIEVPHEHGLSAWQDPTHVRAMNENSWLYYTDWFWYLGWFEHRFKLVSSDFLDVSHRKCGRNEAAFMQVVLEKIETSLHERTTARTMRADFCLDDDPVPELHRPQDGPAKQPGGRPASRPEAPAPFQREDASSAAAGDAYYEGINTALLESIPDDARRVIEFGCANGRLGEAFKRSHPDAHWTGIDLSERAVARAALRLDRAIQMDVERPDISALDGDFDVVIFGDLIEHLRDPQAFLRFAHDISARNARLVCCIPNMSHASVIERLLHGDLMYDDIGLLDRTHLRFTTPATFTKWLLDAGWLPQIRVPIPVRHPNMKLMAALLDAGASLGISQDIAVRTLLSYQIVFDACKSFPVSPLADAGRATGLSVVVPVNRRVQFDLNIQRSPGLAEIGAEIIPIEGATSASDAFERGRVRASHPWILFCHQDVYVPSGSGHRLIAELAGVPAEQREHALLGFFGLEYESTGKRELSGFVIDRSVRRDFPAASTAATVDEFAVVMSRDTSHSIDPALGWHCWGTDLCLAARSHANRPSPRIVRVPLFHNSFTSLEVDQSYWNSAAYLMSKYPGVQTFPALAAGDLRRVTPERAT